MNPKFNETPTIQLLTNDGRIVAITEHTARTFFSNLVRPYQYDQVTAIPISNINFQTLSLYTCNIVRSAVGQTEPELLTLEVQKEESLSDLFELTNAAFKLQSSDLIRKFKKPLMEKLTKIHHTGWDKDNKTILNENKETVQLLLEKILTAKIIGSEKITEDGKTSPTFMPSDEDTLENIKDLVKPLTSEEAFNNFLLLYTFKTGTITEIPELKPEIKQFLENNLINKKIKTKNSCCVIT